MKGATKTTANPGRRNVSPGLLPKALRYNDVYKQARNDRIVARKGLKTAVDTLRTARKKIEDHRNYDSMDSAAKKNYPPSDKLSPEQLKAADTTIDEWQPTAKDEHDRFVAAHQRMRDMEKKAGVEKKNRLARTTLTGVGASGLDDGIRAPGTMYGKHGINNLDASHLRESDKMEDVLPWGRAYQGGRRKKTRKKRRRKNKRKTKRRKKTRRRKKRRKSNKRRRTKRR